ncbi:AraC family transcriptional regulator [Arenibacter sp. TNZ]|uniref:helix-turn-helix domain-containing protein n=1 Tax=Arenibacter TaxID=178469 RepID=UPI000CD4000B|nr:MULTISPECIES: AraC family transcriptional regulator [Arenibacter]MCM4173370.1 AraC family transcriptional regulator [Arenibacter sp. TNZ]
MITATLLIKNMVCNRCILAVENILKNNIIPFQKVSIGEIRLMIAPSTKEKEQLNEELKALGFEIIDNNTGRLIEKIKNLVIKRARNEVDEKAIKINLSTYLSENVHHEYTYLSSLFSLVEGRTIENYFIEQRIEKAKELLTYDQMTLSQIAYELNYCGAAHLSKQFKNITGLTPTFFKGMGIAHRFPIDKI